MAQLITVTLETCHANQSGVAWYAYYDGEPTKDELEKAGTDPNTLDEDSQKAMGCNKDGPYTEVPNRLSLATGLRRYYAGWAD